MLLAEKGEGGEVYNQGSMRTNSVLSYILLGLEEAGWEIEKIKTFNGKKEVENPTEPDNSRIFGIGFEKTKIDRLLLADEIQYGLEDEGPVVQTGDKDIKIEFNPERFRPAEVPILLSDTHNIQNIGAEIKYSLKNIINDQLNYFLKTEK